MSLEALDTFNRAEICTFPKAPVPGVPGLPDELPREGDGAVRLGRGSRGLRGRGSSRRGDVLPLEHPTLCQGTWAGAAAPWLQCPLVSPPDLGRGAVSWCLWGGTLSPTRPLRVREPKPARAWLPPGCSGASPHTASGGHGPRRGSFAGPGLRSSWGEQWRVPAPAPLPGTTMAGAGAA